MMILPRVVYVGDVVCYKVPLQKSISCGMHQPASLSWRKNSRAHISASLPARWWLWQGMSNVLQRASKVLLSKLYSLRAARSVQ